MGKQKEKNTGKVRVELDFGSLGKDFKEYILDSRPVDKENGESNNFKLFGKNSAYDENPQLKIDTLNYLLTTTPEYAHYAQKELEKKNGYDFVNIKIGDMYIDDYVYELCFKNIEIKYLFELYKILTLTKYKDFAFNRIIGLINSDIKVNVLIRLLETEYKKLASDELLKIIDISQDDERIEIAQALLKTEYKESCINQLYSIFNKTNSTLKIKSAKALLNTIHEKQASDYLITVLNGYNLDSCVNAASYLISTNHKNLVINKLYELTKSYLREDLEIDIASILFESKYKDLSIKILYNYIKHYSTNEIVFDYYPAILPLSSAEILIKTKHKELAKKVLMTGLLENDLGAKILSARAIIMSLKNESNYNSIIRYLTDNLYKNFFLLQNSGIIINDYIAKKIISEIKSKKGELYLSDFIMSDRFISGYNNKNQEILLCLLNYNNEDIIINAAKIIIETNNIINKKFAINKLLYIINSSKEKELVIKACKVLLKTPYKKFAIDILLSNLKIICFNHFYVIKAAEIIIELNNNENKKIAIDTLIYIINNIENKEIIAESSIILLKNDYKEFPIDKIMTIFDKLDNYYKSLISKYLINSSYQQIIINKLKIIIEKTEIDFFGKVILNNRINSIDALLKTDLKMYAIFELLKIINSIQEYSNQDIHLIIDIIRKIDYESLIENIKIFHFDIVDNLLLLDNIILTIFDSYSIQEFQNLSNLLLYKKLETVGIIRKFFYALDFNSKHKLIFESLFNNRSKIEYDIQEAITHSASGCFLLTGYRGTGKSSIICKSIENNRKSTSQFFEIGGLFDLGKEPNIIGVKINFPEITKLGENSEITTKKIALNMMIREMYTEIFKYHELFDEKIKKDIEILYYTTFQKITHSFEYKKNEPTLVLIYKGKEAIKLMKNVLVFIISNGFIGGLYVLNILESIIYNCRYILLFINGVYFFSIIKTGISYYNIKSESIQGETIFNEETIENKLKEIIQRCQKTKISAGKLIWLNIKYKYILKNVDFLFKSDFWKESLDDLIVYANNIWNKIISFNPFVYLKNKISSIFIKLISYLKNNYKNLYGLLEKSNKVKNKYIRKFISGIFHLFSIVHYLPFTIIISLYILLKHFIKYTYNTIKYITLGIIYIVNNNSVKHKFVFVIDELDKSVNLEEGGQEGLKKLFDALGNLKSLFFESNALFFLVANKETFVYSMNNKNQEDSITENIFTKIEYIGALETDDFYINKNLFVNVSDPNVKIDNLFKKKLSHILSIKSMGNYRKSKNIINRELQFNKLVFENFDKELARYSSIDFVNIARQNKEYGRDLCKDGEIYGIIDDNKDKGKDKKEENEKLSTLDYIEKLSNFLLKESDTKQNDEILYIVKDKVKLPKGIYNKLYVKAVKNIFKDNKNLIIPDDIVISKGEFQIYIERLAFKKIFYDYLLSRLTAIIENIRDYKVITLENIIENLNFNDVEKNSIIFRDLIVFWIPYLFQCLLHYDLIEIRDNSKHDDNDCTNPNNSNNDTNFVIYEKY